MRIRRKPWARPELEASNFFERSPKSFAGIWSKRFAVLAPIHLELGCGKGIFISKLASLNPGVNYVGLDIKDEMLVLAKRNIEKEYSNRGIPINNIILASCDISRINSVFFKNDVVERIYINFCNPWPRNKHKKRRLTHVRQINQYRVFLKEGGEIYFKTDDDDLFNDSIEYFECCNFRIVHKTNNLDTLNFFNNIETEHEKMFKEMGRSIKFLVAKKV